MKIQSMLAIVSSVLLANVAVGSELHDADRALETNLRQALNQRHVHIDVHDGIVTIDGEVRTEQDRQTIDSTVRNTPGVAAVKDKLKVKFPTPGTSTYAPSIPPASSPAAVVSPSIPVYTTPAPEVTTPVPVVNSPAPVIVPDFPKVKVQAWTEEDGPAANKIARELRHESLPASGFDNVTITVKNGVATLQGIVNTREAHDGLIATIQQGGGLTAIYDQLQIK